MKDNNQKYTDHIIISHNINEYISIKCESCNNYKNRFKIVIYIKNLPLITIPGPRFPSIEDLYQDTESSLKNDEMEPRLKMIKTIYKKLRSKLIVWSENFYNIDFLEYKIAFPLLKELRRVGETKFQIIFQQEILKQYANKNAEVKEYLKHEGYLKLIGNFF